LSRYVLPVFIFGLRATIDLEISSKTTKNLIRTGECVLNLPSDGCAAAVDHLAQLAGTVSDPQKGSKLWRSYCGKEFQATRLTPAPSEVVSAPRALECPVQLEAAVTGRQRLNREKCEWGRHSLTIEVRILRVYIDPSTVLENGANRGGSDMWKPLMACLQEAYQPS
jgi:flavin reductase (DIM6/NTAB) family NADH-FMN oxidoreductase RutF